MEKVLSQYVQDKSITNPLTGKHLSINQRIDNMYNIITNKIYGEKFTIEERIFCIFNYNKYFRRRT